MTMLCSPSTSGALRLTLRTNGLPFVLSVAQRAQSKHEPVLSRAEGRSAVEAGMPDVRASSFPRLHPLRPLDRGQHPINPGHGPTVRNLSAHLLGEGHDALRPGVPVALEFVF